MRKTYIDFIRNCWNEEAYFGFKEGKVYTEGFPNVDELVKSYPEFKGCKVYK